jgi:site-specific recombinase XerD
MASRSRSDAVAAPAMAVDVEKMEAVRPPVRRTADGALVADWGRVPARVYVAGLSGEGRRTMTACLEAIAAWLSDGAADIDTLPWAALRFAHTTAIRAALARAVSEGRYAPATANKHLAALRGALKAAWRLGMMETDDYLRAVDLRPVPGTRLPAGRDVEAAELAALLSACRADDSPAGIRDAAVIALAYLSGLRRAELVSLHLADVEVDPPSVRVVGKGGRQRLVPLSPTVGPALQAWLTLRGDGPGALFCPIGRGGAPRLGRGLTGEAVRQLLRRRALAAGLAAVSPHDLRRSYAGDLLDAGADLPAVQQLLGHASPATTSRYDRRGDRARRAAAERLSLDLSRPPLVPADGALGTGAVVRGEPGPAVEER